MLPHGGENTGREENEKNTPRFSHLKRQKKSEKKVASHIQFCNPC